VAEQVRVPFGGPAVPGCDVGLVPAQGRDARAADVPKGQADQGQRARQPTARQVVAGGDLIRRISGTGGSIMGGSALSAPGLNLPLSFVKYLLGS